MADPSLLVRVQVYFPASPVFVSNTSNPTLYPSQVKWILLHGCKIFPSFFHWTSGIGLPRNGANNVNVLLSSIVVSLSSLRNTGLVSDESPLTFAEIIKKIYHTKNIMYRYILGSY